jgi:hypothetical protein
MATVAKDFKIKNGLIVEGSTGTINNYDILTKSSADQTYIIGLIGGAATPTNTPNTVVLRDGSGNFAAGTITASLSGNVTGDLTGNVTGNVSGNVTGNVTGNLTGNVTGNVTGDVTGNLTGNVSGNVTGNLTGNVTGDVTGNVTGTVSSIANHDTDDLAEGTTNKYFSDTLARGAVSAGDGLDYNSTSGAFSADLGTGLHIESGAIAIDSSVLTDTGNQTVSNKTLGSNLDAGGYKVTNLDTPSSADDAATKGYVDAVAEGLNIHASSKAATTANIDLATGGLLMIDGYQTIAGDRILVKDQSNAAQNGIYVVAAGAWSRAADFDTPVEIVPGDFTFVEGGSTYGDTGWVQTNTVTTVGTSPIAFTQFSGAGTYQAGTNLDLTGNTFALQDNITLNSVTADLTGNVTGNVNGDVTGNLSGNVTGDVTGNLTGNVSGNVTGNVTGNLSGDVTGNVTGNVSGNVTGNVTGDLTGNVTGNLDGDVTGNVTGNVTGDVTGNLTGNVSGNVTGNLTGNVTGDVTGNVTGTVSSLANHNTSALAEGSNLYFTDARAVTALEAVVPNFTEVDINDVVTHVAATQSVATASTVTAYDFAHATYRSAKFIVKAETATHTEVSEILLTLDASNNVAITEYAMVGTNGNLFDVTADVSGADVRVRVTTINSNTDVTVVGTLIK